ncbi:MAG: YggT family protein [Rhizobiales bacterium]|nr:YggT family protein [Hyphomicrobiales bacterium]
MNPFIWLVLTILNIYFWVILISVIMSWLIAFGIMNRQNPYVRQIDYALSRLTEPVLGPIRRVMPDLGGLDVSPVVALIGIQFLQYLIAYYVPRFLP